MPRRGDRAISVECFGKQEVTTSGSNLITQCGALSATLSHLVCACACMFQVSVHLVDTRCESVELTECTFHQLLHSTFELLGH
mmetsp:Transcript_28266/g.87620  ORF Transcript_28266/g.87620 Transcript_28266/m.87620 type:complete len:83 (-) Transcript_28266:120-368(-)